MEKDTSDKALAWAKREVSVTTEEYCKRLDTKLWQGVQKDCVSIRKDAEKILSTIPFSLGGGGNFPLIYFLVRKFKPRVVVETGVAAGWSSLAILRAFHKNKSGRLFSSDFPYFRLDNPEQFIGIITRNEPNKNSWDLDISGDEKALPQIVTKLGASSIDLVHYDSDKSYSGRSFAMQVLRNKLSKDAIIVVDDIQDNLHFKDYVHELDLKYSVLEFEGKYVGIIEGYTL
jgi:predicted O-methyltransferase YrrM